MILIFNSNLSFAATLPAGYTELEYIESTGIQFIDSGIYPDKNTEIETVAKTKDNHVQYLFGVSGEDGKRYMIAQSNGNLMFDFIGVSNRITSSVNGYTDFHKIEIKDQSFIVDETTFGSFAALNNFTQTNTAYVFDAHNNSWGSDTGVMIKYLKIWQSGTLVRDYIPAEYNGQIGMYDAVSGNFFTNAETRYTQLEYLTSNQSKQYIEDVSFGLITTGTIEIKTKNLAPACRFAGWGDKNSYDVDIGLATPNSDTNWFPYYYNGWVNPSGSSAVNIANENKLRLDFAPGDQKLYINDVLNKKTSNSVPADRNLPFGLFRISSSGYTGCGTIYYCKVFNGDELRRHYIPVRRDSDGAIGMYETTTRAFLTNAGTGSFTVGPDTDVFQNDFIAGPRICDDYTVLEYMRTTGHNKWIDTGYIPSAEKTRIVAKVDFFNRDIDNKLFNAGAWLEDLYQLQRLNNVDGNNNNELRARYYADSSDVYYDTPSSFVDTDNPVYIDFNKNVLNINGDTVHVFPVKNQTSGTTLRIFYQTSVGGNDMNLYYFKVYDNNTLVRDFVPARCNLDGEIGLYDLANNVFYINAGTGTFTAGPAINTCENSLGIMDEEMCVEKVAPAWPYLTAWSNGQKYYIKLSEDDYPIHSGSSTKIKIKINDNLIYTMHDDSVE